MAVDQLSPVLSPSKGEVDDLARLGMVLYGAHWKAPAARALGVSLSTVQRYCRGERPGGVVAAAVARLRAVAWLRVKELAAVARAGQD